VNAIAPGFVFTPILGAGKSIEEWNEIVKTFKLVHRIGNTEEVAKFVCFLLSDDASFITGSVEAIDGGMLLT
jgi:3-oxoacyl-[acyl-carrier protein] reductase